MPYKIVEDAFRRDYAEGNLVYYEDPIPGPQGEQGPKDDKGDKGDQGEPGSPKDCWPIDSIFSCAVDTDPEKLLGFGKWECIQKEPFYCWQRKE